MLKFGKKWWLSGISYLYEIVSFVKLMLHTRVLILMLHTRVWFLMLHTRVWFLMLHTRVIFLMLHTCVWFLVIYKQKIKERVCRLKTIRKCTYIYMHSEFYRQYVCKLIAVYSTFVCMKKLYDRRHLVDNS
jgi:hypothetical protein